jgi:hypothetical protein
VVAEGERDGDLEIAAAVQCREQGGMIVGARDYEGAVRRHELDRDQVVAGEAVLALEPTRLTADRETGNRGR